MKQIYNNLNLYPNKILPFSDTVTNCILRVKTLVVEPSSFLDAWMRLDMVSQSLSLLPYPRR